MTSTTTNTVHPAPAAGFVTFMKKVFSGIGQGMVAHMESKSRLAEIEALNAKTDAELAEMGIKREEIARHVFRDIMFV